jgi:hypothetical protein
MRKIILGLVATAAIASPLALATSANADAPDGTWGVIEIKANDNAIEIGRLSSAIKQNGQHVSGNGSLVADQTTTPGSRAALVQTALGH